MAVRTVNKVFAMAGGGVVEWCEAPGCWVLAVGGVCGSKRREDVSKRKNWCKSQARGKLSVD
jgi:hypothetical protein